MQKRQAIFSFMLLLLLAGSFRVCSQNQNIILRDTIQFPGQSLSNIWGFKKGGKEYALVGASKGLVIVDVTDPANCFRVGVQLKDSINSSWREVRTFGNYAYITSEGLTPAGNPPPFGSQTGGLGIVDLSGLPNNPPVTVTKYHAAGASDPSIANNLQRAHSLHVDSVRSMLYLYGASGVNCNGALRFSLSNPAAPVYKDKYCTNYVHDGYVHKDTLYAALIYAGKMAILKFQTNPDDGVDTLPTLLGDAVTPNAFTHNTWLSVNRQYAFTTDEKQNSFLAAYDVSDPTDMVLKDKIRTTTANSIVHNTYVKGNFAVTSWYEDGMTITDVSRPGNLIQTGRFDTYATPPFPVPSNHFEGAWGVYPYLPSGNLLVTNISENKILSNADTGVLYILTPTYVSACFLEGSVKDSVTNANIFGASVAIQHTDPLNNTTTGLDGNYATGQPTAGTFNVVYSASGYVSQTVPVTLNNGVVTIRNMKLLQAGAASAIALTGNLAFGTVPAGGSSQRTFTIHNPGNAPLVVSSISYPFPVFSGNWSGGTIAPSGSQIVTVTFAPLAQTAYSGMVTVTSNAASGTNTIAISGMGDPCPLNFTLSFNPADMDTVSASKTLATSGAITVAASTQVLFRAGTSITLAPDFTVELGSDFTAKMEDCNASSSILAPASERAAPHTKAEKISVLERMKKLFNRKKKE